MLIQFTVENYKSFRDKTVLSLEASSDKELKNNFSVFGANKILNSAAIFGANASGKSNLFLALYSAVHVIKRSDRRQINEPIFRIEPYCFNEEYKLKPTSFEFVFIAKGKKYVYGFSATKRKITEEYLYVYNTAKASVVFERNESNEYRFTSSAIKNELSPIIERNSDNKLFLSTATAWNCESTRTAYLWFSEKMNAYANDDRLFQTTNSMFDDDEDNTLKEFTTKLLHEADINIDDYEVESFQIGKEVGINKDDALSLPIKRTRIKTAHTIYENGQKNVIYMPLIKESQGTKNLFMLSPILKRAFENGETIFIDEFDANLHPLLVIFLLKLFNNPSVNKTNAQLIITAHSTDLLSLDVLRRDQIYFIEKNRKNAVSELYSLDEFSPRKDENVRKAYLMGRYGSLPMLPEEAEL